MKSASDFYVFEKWRDAPTGAFGIKNRPAVVSPEEKEAYWRIYSELREVSEAALNDHGAASFFLKPKQYSRERGSRGHRPVDLWVSICGEGAQDFGYMPQVYAIASERGLEVGFAASIPEEDYFDTETKRRNRTIVPLINSRLPNPIASETIALANQLTSDGGWVFSTQTRLVAGNDGYNLFQTLPNLLSSLKGNGATSGGGAITRTYAVTELDVVDLYEEFRLALTRFGALLTLAKPTSWDVGVLEDRHQIEALRVHEEFDPSSLTDGRTKVLAEIARRQGQGRFRNDLLKNYDGRCAVSGCDVSDVLEAAHILPYLGPQTNHPSNGILLRADLHTLFDLALIKICPDTLSIAVSPALSQSAYKELEGTQLRVPAVASLRPNVEALKKRWDVET